MKKVIVLLSGIVIAASAAAQADKTASDTTQATRTGNVDRQIPANTDRDRRENPAPEDPESANIAAPDFRGSSKQQATASGMARPKKESEKTSTSSKSGADVQDVENKTKQ